MAAAATLAAVGPTFPGDLAKSASDIGAFALVAWTWWWLVRHGMPRLIGTFLEHIKRIEDAHREDLRLEREQREENAQRIIDALDALVDENTD